MVLTDRDRMDMHGAVVEYLRAQRMTDLADQLEARFAKTKVYIDSDTNLERRWNTLRRLNLRNVDLEAQVKQLQKEVRELQDPTASMSKGSDLLPSEPSTQTFRGHRDALTAVVLHPYEPIGVSASEDATIRVWDVANRGHLRTIREHSENVNAIAIEPLEAKLLASCSNDQTVKLIDIQTGECTRTLHGHTEGVASVCWVGDVNKTLISASRDGEMRVWDTERGGMKHTMKESCWVRAMVPSFPGSSLIACAANDNFISLWNWNKKEQLGKFVVHTNVVQSVCFSDYETDCTIIEAHGSRDAKESLRAHQRKFNTINSSNGLAATMPAIHSSMQYEPRFVASGARDKLVVVTDILLGTAVLILADHGNWVRQVRFSANGKYLISCSDDGTVLVSDLSAKRVHRKILAHDHFCTCFALHPTNKAIMMTGSADTTVKLWPCK